MPQKKEDLIRVKLPLLFRIAFQTIGKRFANALAAQSFSVQKLEERAM
jgi:hypothetical protein